MDWNHTFALLAVAFASNLVLGKWRSLEKRLSFRWFVAVHLSVPLVVFLRIYWQLPIWLIPIAIGVAVSAQFIGVMLPYEKLLALKRTAR